MLTKAEIVDLLKGSNDDWLYKTADELKKCVYGQDVFIRGIIENSNICNRNCLYCGIRAQNNNINRYSLSQEQVLSIAKSINDQGIKSIVLQSGESNHITDVEIAKTISLIKQTTDADITLSFGEKTFDTYKLWRDAGADRYLLKLETMQEDVYQYSHPGYTLKDRIKCLEHLQKLDYQVGSGFIWGLPCYTSQMFAQDLLSLQSFGVHMYSTTPLVASANTPYANLQSADVDMIYRSNAIYRILEPSVNIPVASACASLDKDSKEKGLQRGANVLMLSFTPQSIRKDYAIYRGKNNISSENLTDFNRVIDSIKKANLTPAFVRGCSKYKKEK